MKFPWYDLVAGDAPLEQGDLLRKCPVFRFPADVPSDAGLDLDFEIEDFDLVIISQTCDLVPGREKVGETVLCPVWDPEKMDSDSFLRTKKGMEEARRGNLPAYHLINGCEIDGYQFEVRIVEFRRIFTLPVPTVRAHCAEAGERLRLLPPYREHLAQAFARFFMRVGLPSDIPPFR